MKERPPRWGCLYWVLAAPIVILLIFLLLLFSGTLGFEMDD